MTDFSIPGSTLRQTAAALRDGRVSATALMAEATSAYKSHHRANNTYKTWDGDRAAETADIVDRMIANGRDAGPLMGVPISIKDIFGVPGMPIYAGSSRQLPADWEQAGPMVMAVLQQMAPITGKTHSVEFAFGGLGTNSHWGTPRNPWDGEQHRVPGGSSAGAGVSLIEGSAMLAFGTDTAGSVRVPASMTGVAGLKTTSGRWSTAGIVPLSSTLDTPGLLARSVDDLAFAYDAIDGALSPRSMSVMSPPLISDLRLGVPEQYFFDDCSPGVAEGVRAAIGRLEQAGARIVTLDLPRCDEAFDMFKLGALSACELAAFLRGHLPEWLDILDPNVRHRVDGADQVSSWEYVRRREILNSMARDADAAIADVDAVLTPTVASTPPTVDSLAEEGAYPRANMLALRNTAIGNLMTLAAVTMPVGKDGADMPIGLQLLGRAWSEPRLLAVAQSIEGLLGRADTVLGVPPAYG
ncbi:amidase [Fodinicurvata sp. EGI_FJ10296]|uniref:amidase n=1 Tax=Fodinicurvata sp. EGI_FJ10296 TaxID=3231908 RepID=UPI0034571A17